MNLVFVANSILLGVGLAMDAFSVSIANGINDPNMRVGERFKISGVYAWFQFMMPMIGWICVHTIVEQFEAFEKFIPWIALILLLYIGGKMVWDGVHGLDEEEAKSLTWGVLIMQGIATSIDALSVGFTIAGYGTGMAFLCSLIIAVVTLLICLFGLKIGRTVGEKFADHATVFGGCILIFIGLEIFIKGIFF